MKYVSRKASVLLAAFSTLASISTSAIAKPIYMIENLGTVGAPQSSSSAVALNESGQVVGTYTNDNGDNQAFVWDALNGMQSLGTLGGNYSSATDINNHGQIVGVTGTAVEGQESGFIYENGVMSQILDLTPSQSGAIKSSTARGINDAGQIVGSHSEAVYNDQFQYFEPVHKETFLKTGDDLQLSGRLDINEGPYSSVDHIGANALNENGDYTGLAFSEFNGGSLEVFVKRRNQDIVGIGNLGGFVGFGFDINDNGTVVGRSRLEDREDGYHAFIYTDLLGMIDMNDVFGFESSNLRNINNSNMAVGWGSNTFATVDQEPVFTPFLFDVDGNKTFFLNDFLDVDSDFASLDFAYSINENNDIVGYGTTKDGHQRAFLMSFQGEVPEPSTIALLMSAILMLAAKRKFNAK
ncbi:DUF3466 family protein [Aliiglaciecola litoralis]|uniref:PEP-CTERM protein-sorting domain-containing protein n=1 Tax=Aliiglaciecola litoralis TaxID=582857 RepID=A0ABP3WYX2_9ALTE